MADLPGNAVKMAVVVHSIPQATQKTICQMQKCPWKRVLRSIPVYLRVWQTEPHRQQKAAKNGVVCFWVHLIKPIRLDMLPEKQICNCFFAVNLWLVSGTALTRCQDDFHRRSWSRAGKVLRSCLTVNFRNYNGAWLTKSYRLPFFTAGSCGATQQCAPF